MIQKITISFRQVAPRVAATLLTFALLLTPLISFAATPLCASNTGTIGEFKDLVCLFVNIIYSLVPLLISLMVLVFFWGLAKFIWHAGDSKARAEGRQVMIWGVVGLFVATSLLGILRFLYSNFSFSDALGFPPKLPRI